MLTILHFFRLNAFLGYFVYGSGYIAILCALILSHDKWRLFRIRDSLYFLIPFSLLLGLGEWINAYLAYSGYSDINSSILYIKEVFVVSGFAFLLLFGVRGLCVDIGVLRMLRPLPYLLIILFAGGIILTKGRGGDLLTIIDALERYIFAFPAMVLSSVLLYRESKNIKGVKGLPEGADIYMLIASFLFLLQAIFFGFLPYRVSFFPASLINQEGFELIFNMPVEVIETIILLGIAYSIVRLLPLSVWARLTGTYIALSILILVIGLGTYRTLTNTRKQFQETINIGMESTALMELEVTMDGFGDLLHSFLLSRDRAIIDRLKKTDKVLKRTFEFYKALHEANSNEWPIIDATEMKIKKLRAIFKRLIDGNNLTTEEIDSIEKEIDPLLTGLREDSEQMLEVHLKENREIDERNRIIFSSVTMVVLIGIVFAILGSIFLGTELAAFFSRPLMALKDGAVKIGKGRLDHRIEIATGDEVEDVADEFNRMAELLKKREKELVEANQKLIRAERLAAIGEIGITIRHEINNPLTSILGNAQLILSKDDRIPEDIRKQVKTIEKMSLRIKDIIKRLEHIEDAKTTEYVKGVKMIALEEERDDRKQDTDSG